MTESCRARFVHAAVLMCTCLALGACTMGPPPTASTTIVVPTQSAQVPPPIVNTTDRFWPASRIDETMPRMP